MSQPTENKHDNTDDKANKIIRATTVIACSATGYACLVEDIEQTCSVIEDAANINAPLSGPSVNASNEVVESASVIALSATGFQPPSGSMTRSRKLLNIAAAVSQLSPDETRPPRAPPSRSGATFMNLLVNSDDNKIPGRDVRGLRTSPPEPMQIDDDTTIAPISNRDSNNHSSADKVEVSPRSNISTRASDTSGISGNANANTPGNDIREEREGHERREGRTTRSMRTASSNSDNVCQGRMHASTSENLRSNLRNIADDNASSSLVCTPKVFRGKTYRSRRHAQKTKKGALRAKSTTPRKGSADNDTSESNTVAASDTSHRSRRSTGVASGRVTRSTSSTFISNPRPTTKTPTTSTESQSPCATVTFTPCHATITIGPDGETTMLVDTNTGTSSSGALPRSTNGKTNSIAAALAVPVPPIAVEMLTFPAEITFESEVIGEGTADIRGAMLMPVSPSLTDHESGKETSGDSSFATNITFPSSNNIGANNGDTASDTTVSTTINNLVMDSDNITVRPLSPADTQPTMTPLGTTPLPSVHSGSTIETTPSSDELVSNVSADDGENEKA